MSTIFSVKHLLLAFGILLPTTIYLYATVITIQPTSLLVQKAGDGVVALLSVDQKYILINTGSDASILRTLGTALSPWQRSLSLVILTDSKTVHIGGLVSLLERYKAENVLRLGTGASKNREELIATVLSPDTEMSRAPYGARLIVAQLTITLGSPDIVIIENKNRKIVVSSTTREGTYTF